eukprot:TRINITY_DN74669_c0_g1_i1.p1 TRINITY_DN74669_c0_g1~~TRINITY_DN74669_c0_g1_i1.p1  ORF type:complete len:175 (-),score=17.93 TRINITY_DN74669_c0_g1_i1:271-768(-)
MPALLQVMFRRNISPGFMRRGCRCIEAMPCIRKCTFAGTPHSSGSEEPNGKPFSPTRFLAIAAPLGGGLVWYYWWHTEGRAQAARRRERETRESEWRESAGKLRNFYAQQGASKADPEPGTALAHFVNVNRAAKNMPTRYSLSDWQVSELESIEGWRWHDNDGGK